MTSVLPNLGKAVRAIIGSLLASYLIYQIVFLAFPPYASLRVSIAAQGGSDVFQLRYRDTMAEPYVSVDVATAEFKNTRGYQDIVFYVPPTKTGFLRFDPIGKPGDVFLRRICIGPKGDKAAERCWDAEGIARDFIARDHIDKFELESGTIHLHSMGSDPYFETGPPLEAGIRELAARPAMIQLSLVCLGGLLVLLLLLFIPEFTPSSAIWFSTPTKVVGVIALICGYLFATQSVRQIVPPFQGADEIDHISKLASYELGLPCGEIPRVLADSWDRVSYLPHHPEAKWKKGAFGAQKGEGETVTRENGTCRYSSIYLSLPSIFNRAMENNLRMVSVADYVWRTRISLSFSAALCFLCSFILVVFGSSVWRFNVRDEAIWRMAAFLTSVYVLFLPQTIWLGSVFNQDYLLISAGLFLALGVLFRIPFFSDWLNILCLAASVSKGAYVFPYLVLIAAHYVGLACPTHFRNSRRLALGFILSFAIALGAGGYLLETRTAEICQTYYCYGLEDSGLFQSWEAFKPELQTMLKEYSVLGLPAYFHQESAFGNFGWLDAPMPSYFASLYTGPISFLGIAGLASFLVLLILRFLRAEVEPPHFGVLLQAFFCAYWILAFLSLYVVFFVMLQWCGAGADFGCGYQKRYELPLYPFIALTLFLFSIDCVSRLAERFYRDKGVRILLFFFLVCCQSVCCYYTYRGMLQTIHSRYFVSAGSEKSHS